MRIFVSILSDRLPEYLSDRMPGYTSIHLSHRMPKCMPLGMPEYMSDTRSEYTSGTMSVGGDHSRKNVSWWGSLEKNILCMLGIPCAYNLHIVCCVNIFVVLRTLCIQCLLCKPVPCMLRVILFCVYCVRCVYCVHNVYDLDCEFYV